MDDIATILKNLGDYLWFVLLAMIGGTINYISRVKRNAAQRFSLVELLGEWFVSGFVGVLTIYLGLWLGWPMPMIGFSCGISGHLAGRIMYMLDTRAADVLAAVIDRWTK